mmetsp:Transcript_14109/g.21110  ORF Transcript_14109/g.21110 Transcript_14109/m.21110 type:complete len:106 (+) Transcript_14109:311-628(+)
MIFDCLGFNINDDVICENRSRCSSEEAFLILLSRLASYKRLTDISMHFGIETTQVSRILNATIDIIVQRNHHLVYNNIAFFVHRFEMYNAAIRRKLGPNNSAAVE